MIRHDFARASGAREIVTRCLITLVLSLVAESIAANTVSPVSVTLPQMVRESRSIFVGQVDSIGGEAYQTPSGAKSTLPYIEVRVEQLVKPAAHDFAPQVGSVLRLVDPREKFRRDHAELIAGGVISYVERTYHTKARPVSIPDHLIFFVGEAINQISRDGPSAYFLTCSGSYEAVTAKSVVLRLLSKSKH